MVGTDRQSQLTTKSEKQAGDGEAGDVYPALHKQIDHLLQQHTQQLLFFLNGDQEKVN